LGGIAYERKKSDVERAAQLFDCRRRRPAITTRDLAEVAFTELGAVIDLAMGQAQHPRPLDEHLDKTGNRADQVTHSRTRRDTKRHATFQRKRRERMIGDN
jgi:hypothetical protein